MVDGADDESLLPRLGILIPSLVAGAIVYVVIVEVMPLLASTDQEELFADQSWFRIWTRLVGAVGGLSAALVAPLCMWLWRLRDTFPWRYVVEYRGWLNVTVVLLALAALLFLPQVIAVRGEAGWGIGRYGAIPTVTIGMAALAALPAGFGMLAVALGADRVPDCRIDRAEVARFTLVRSHLKAFLVTGGTLIALGMMATGALHNTVVEFQELDASPPADVPLSEVIVLYGGFMTALLAFMYFPAHRQLERRGRRMVMAEVPYAFDPVAAHIAGEQERADAISSLLGLGTSASRAFRGGVVVVAPLISSLLALFRS